MTHRRFPYRLFADLVRVGAAVGVAAGLFAFPGHGGGARFLLVLLALLVPRALGGVPAPLDLALGVTLLATAWASTSLPDSPVGWPLHAVATGLTAAVLWLVLAHAGIDARGPGSVHRRGPDPGAVVVQTVTIGMLVSVAWEGLRWLDAVTRQVGGPTQVAASPVAHVLVGTAGALAAGWALAASLRRSDRIGANVDRPRA